MPLRAVIAWALAGALGLAAAAGVSLAASHLTSQPIGLQAEPLTAGETLAPSPPTTTGTGAGVQPRTATAPPARPRAAPEDDDRDSHVDDRRGDGREQHEPDQDD